MWDLRPEPKYFSTFSLFGDSITFVFATAMLFRCTVFKTNFDGTCTSFTFQFSQQVCGLTLRESMWCSLRSWGFYGRWRQLQTGFPGFSLWLWLRGKVISLIPTLPNGNTVAVYSMWLWWGFNKIRWVACQVTPEARNKHLPATSLTFFWGKDTECEWSS